MAASTSSVVEAQSAESAFSFHAAINAAGGVSSGLPNLGVPSYGTIDYRTAAMQFRYRLENSDQFVVQLVNRRLGVSPLQAALPEVSLQWAYWQRRGSLGTIKVGRNPMPRGLFNEITFVGTVLPFFRPSFEIYGEGRETVDGFVYTKSKSFGDASIQRNAFGGSNEVRTQVVTATGNSIRAFRGNALMGTQVWLNLAPGQTRIGGYFAQYPSTQQKCTACARKSSRQPKRTSCRAPRCVPKACTFTARVRIRTVSARMGRPWSP